ncbi:site-specific integrase [Candidatus Tisiphia endosymbiont of Parasteatoda lunata]|uniref:site-specific integrase n=1 Tax=Candidatus Tisiphia endosymbiont of Parasteatoda lunata TaxID=3066275 RepID=UPI00313EF63D
MAHLESVTTQKNISVKCKILLKNILSFLDKIFKIYVETTHCKCGVFLPKWDNKPYSERGIRKILMTYTQQANMNHTITPHKLRHFLFTWMKKQGIDDALIQPYSGHESRQSLEIYSKLSITDAQKTYNKVINDFPI